MENVCSLKDMAIGQKGSVVSLRTVGDMRRRLQDIGLIKGTTVKCVLKSPGGDPIAYHVKGAIISIRNEDAENIVCKIK